MPKKKFKKSPHLIVKRGIHGLGLFAGEEIKRSDFVIAYVGEKLTTKEANRRGGRYLFVLNRKHTLDGKARSNRARYINHSCKPNCYVERDPHKETLEIFARRRIMPGEELSYDYGKEYMDEIIGGVKNCKCEIHVGK